MDVYPAIDIRGGRCVRLYRGDYDRETVYGNDPMAQARTFVQEGASWLHVVDLDAARSGKPENRDTIAAIAQAVTVRVQTGGGVRTDEAADALWSAGVHRVVVGTAATERPDWVKSLAQRGAVAVGLDANGRDVAVRGWTESSGLDLVEFAQRFEDAGVEALIVTEISRDGTLSGPDLDQLGAVLDATDLAVIASGGVGSLDDLRALDGLRRGDRALDGAICGRAIYEGAFSVREAVDLLAQLDSNDPGAS